MNNLQIFSNNEFGQVRVVEIDGDPWFVGRDVADILGYQDTSDALKRHVDIEDKLTRCFTDSGQSRQMYIINESGLYSLVLSSKLPGAKRFKKWVTSEVLPAIRKHGMYATPETIKQSLRDPGYLAQILLVLQEEQQKNEELKEVVGAQDKQIEEMTPKARYYDLVLACKDTVSITVIAKDYGWSAIKMNGFLQQLGVQYKRGDLWLLYQKYADKGYTASRTQSYLDGKSMTHVKTHTYWTQKGRLFIYDLLKERGILPVIERELFTNYCDLEA